MHGSLAGPYLLAFIAELLLQVAVVLLLIWVLERWGKAAAWAGWASSAALLYFYLYRADWVEALYSPAFGIWLLGAVPSALALGVLSRMRKQGNPQSCKRRALIAGAIIVVSAIALTVVLGWLLSTHRITGG